MHSPFSSGQKLKLQSDMDGLNKTGMKTEYIPWSTTSQLDTSLNKGGIRNQKHASYKQL